ncbi:MAG: hypothetical protein R3D81_03620 [Thalassovita sp.]
MAVSTRAEIYGGSGNDTIIGGEGSDTIMAGSEDDLVYGEAGSDLSGRGEYSRRYRSGAGQWPRSDPGRHRQRYDLWRG